MVEQIIPGYELLEKIGEGGMATVWKARQISLDRIVAVKILSQSSLPNEAARDFFRGEAVNAGRLNHHGLVAIYDAAEDNGVAYIIMEYVDGTTVYDRILQQGSIPEKETLSIALQVARVLDYAWDKECMIHCDLKPDNLLLYEASGEVKIADLGVARLIGLHRGRQNEIIIGTPNYISPEQSEGIPDLDCRTDMYALGMTMYHMVTGTIPFKGSQGSEAMDKQSSDFLKDPRELKPELSDSLVGLMEVLTMKNRAFRPQFWPDVIKALEGLSKGRPLPWKAAEKGQSTILRTVVPKESPITKRPVVTVNAPAAKKITVSGKDLKSAASNTRVKKRRPLRTVLIMTFLVAVAFGAMKFVKNWQDRGSTPHNAMPMGQVSPTESPAVPVMPEPEEVVVDEKPVLEEDPAPAKATWNREMLNEGARLFNKALDKYKAYQEDRSNPLVLQEIVTLCRTALERFEACRDVAPPGVPIAQYITDCQTLLADARYMMRMANITEAPVEKPMVKTVYAAGYALPAMPKTLAFSSFWDHRPNRSTPASGELYDLLLPFAEASSSLQADASILFFDGMHYAMPVKEAASVRNLELDHGRSMIQSSALPQESLYLWTGTDVGDRYDEVVLVGDRDQRLVMIMFVDINPTERKFKPGQFKTHWKTYDFLRSRVRNDQQMVAHRVVQKGNLLRIDTELVEANPDSPQEAGRCLYRSSLVLPRHMASLILHRIDAAR